MEAEATGQKRGQLPRRGICGEWVGGGGAAVGAGRAVGQQPPGEWVLEGGVRVWVGEEVGWVAWGQEQERCCQLRYGTAKTQRQSEIPLACEPRQDQIRLRERKLSAALQS